MANRDPGPGVCSSCGNEIDATAAVCPDCGADQERIDAEQGATGTDDGGRTGPADPGGPEPGTSPGDPEGGTGGSVQRERAAGSDQVGGVQPADGERSDRGGQPGGEEPKSRLVAGGIGAVVAFFFGWIPIVGPLVGGLVGGYLRGPDTKEGAITGLLATVIASVPAAILALLFLTLGGIGAAAQGDGQAAVGLVVWVVIFAVGFAYFYALGALGGFIGASMSDRRPPS